MNTRTLLLLLVATAGCKHVEWTAAQLQGRWVSPCAAVHADIGFSQQSLQETETFTAPPAQTVEIAQRYYTDAQCKEPYFTRTVSAAAEVGAYTLPAGARTLDLTELAARVRPETIAAASDLSQQFYCSTDQWQPGVELDIAGRSCNGVPTPPVQSRVYQIAQVIADLLFLGSRASADGTTPATRPTVLSQTPYERAH